MLSINVPLFSFFGYLKYFSLYDQQFTHFLLSQAQLYAFKRESKQSLSKKILLEFDEIWCQDPVLVIVKV